MSKPSKPNFAWQVLTKNVYDDFTLDILETPTVKFDDYLERCDSIQPHDPVSVNGINDAFFNFQKTKKRTKTKVLVMMAYSFNVVKNYFGPLHKPSLHIFNLWIQKGFFFPDELKIARECQYIKATTKLIQKNYEIRWNNLKLFESYLNNQKQFISFNKKNIFSPNKIWRLTMINIRIINFNWY